MIDLYQVQALEAVVREGSFSKAGQRLGLTQPAISERIRGLEESVGQPVIVRKTPIRPTAMGQKLLNYFHQVQLLEDSVLATQKPEASVPIPVAVNFDSLATWFISAVATALPVGYRLEILADDQSLTPRLLVQGSVLGCITSERQAPSGCESKYLGTMKYVAVATPTFVKHILAGRDGESLAEAPAVIYGWDDKLHDIFLGGVSRKQGKSLPRYWYVPHILAMKELILTGRAYGLLPLSFVEDELRAKQLIQVAPDRPLLVKLYWHTTIAAKETLRPISDALLKYAQLSLRQD